MTRSTRAAALASAALLTLALLPLMASAQPAPPAKSPSPDADTGAADGKADPALIAKGGKLFVDTGCVACHTTDGRRHVGPTVKGIYGEQVKLTTGEMIRVDEAYLRTAITNPMAQLPVGYPPAMPNYSGQLGAGDIDALVAYMKSLGGPAKAAAAPKAPTPPKAPSPPKAPAGP